MSTTELDVTGMQNFLTNWVGNCKTQDCYDIIALVRESIGLIHDVILTKCQSKLDDVTYNTDLAQRVIQQQITTELQQIETNLISSQKQVFNQIAAKVEPLKARVDEIIKWMIKQGYSFDNLNATTAATELEPGTDSNSEYATASETVQSTSTVEKPEESEVTNVSNATTGTVENTLIDAGSETGNIPTTVQPAHSTQTNCSQLYWLVYGHSGRNPNSLAIVAFDQSTPLTDINGYGPYLSPKGAERAKQALQNCLPLVGRNPILPSIATAASQATATALALPSMPANGLQSSGNVSDAKTESKEETIIGPTSMVYNLSTLSQFLGGPYLSPSEATKMVENLGPLFVDTEQYIAPIELDDEDYDLWP